MSNVKAIISFTKGDNFVYSFNKIVELDLYKIKGDNLYFPYPVILQLNITVLSLFIKHGVKEKRVTYILLVPMKIQQMGTALKAT